MNGHRMQGLIFTAALVLMVACNSGGSNGGGDGTSVSNLDTISKQVDSTFKSFPETTPSDQVLAQTKTYLDANAATLKIQSTTVTDDILEVFDVDGIHSFFQIGPVSTPAPTVVQARSRDLQTSITSAPWIGNKTVKTQSFGPHEVENLKVLIYAPHIRQVGTQSAASTVYTTLRRSTLSFDINFLQNEDADMFSLTTLNKYGFIFIETHGIGGEWLQTGEQTTPEKDQLKQMEMRSGDVARWTYYFGPAGRPGTVQTNSYAVSSKWLSKRLQGNFPKSVIINSICESLKTQNLAGLLRKLGAGVYFGYSKNVSFDFAKQRAAQITNAVAVEFYTAGEAFAAANGAIDPLTGVSLTAVGDKETHFSRPSICVQEPCQFERGPSRVRPINGRPSSSENVSLIAHRQ